VRSPVTLLVLLLCSGCVGLEPAPEDLDGLLHFLWQQYDDGEPEELAEAVRNLHGLVDSEVLAGGVSGEVSLLSEDERALAGVVVDGIPPDKEAGLYLADPFEGCSVNDVEQIMTFLQQDLLYDQYDRYTRVDTSDRTAYFARDTDRLTWDIEYAVTIPLAGQYDALVSGEVRRVEDLGADVTPFGPFIIFRSALTAPATFATEAEVFDQDRRIQLLYAPEDGRLTHIEGLWRHMEAGLADTGSETVRSLIVSGIRDWEDETVAWCGQELP
jgi:hypothetical protein